MNDFALLQLDPKLLDRFRLPNIGYPVPITAAKHEVGAEGEMPLPVLLFGLQEFYRKGGTDWQNAEAAMDRLAHLVTPELDEQTCGEVVGDHWWLEIGPVDLSSEIVTIQRLAAQDAQPLQTGARNAAPKQT